MPDSRGWTAVPNRRACLPEPRTVATFVEFSRSSAERPVIDGERYATVRVTIDPAFDIDVPEGWTAAADEEGGVSVSGPEGTGLLHFIAFAQPLNEDLDPAEELYVFLEDQGIELEE